MADGSQTLIKSTRSLSSSPPPRKRARLSDTTDPPDDRIHFKTDTVAKPLDESGAFVDSYPAVAKSLLERGIRLLAELILKTKEYDISQYRKKAFATDCKGFIDTIKQGEDVKCITAREYRQRIQQPNPDWKKVLVICTSRETRDLLRHYDLHVPLRVPSELNDSPEP